MFLGIDYRSSARFPDWSTLHNPLGNHDLSRRVDGFMQLFIKASGRAFDPWLSFLYWASVVHTLVLIQTSVFHISRLPILSYPKTRHLEYSRECTLLLYVRSGSELIMVHSPVQNLDNNVEIQDFG